MLSPSFGVTQTEVAKRLADAEVKISARSTLVLDGRDIVVNKLNLDGALVVKVTNGSKAVLEDVNVTNDGIYLRQWDSLMRCLQPLGASDIGRHLVLNCFDGT